MKRTDCTDEAKTSPSCVCVFVCGGGGGGTGGGEREGREREGGNGRGGNGREAGDRIEAGTKLYVCSASCFI